MLSESFGTTGISDDILDLHEQAYVVDLHVDSFLLSRQFGYDFMKHHRAWLPYGAFGSHADLPRMRAGGVDAAGFGIVVNPFSTPARAWHNTVRQISLFHQTCQRSRGKLAFATSAEKSLELKRLAVHSGFLGLEGAHTLGGVLDNVETAYQQGVRYITLTHFSSNKAASCAHGWRANARSGLSAWGRELIGEMNRLGMIVDLAHVNKPGFLAAIRTSKKPCMVSHGGVAGVHKHWRNTDDDNLRALFDGGGIIGIMFAPQFISFSIRDTSAAVLRHIDYVVSHFGEDFVALGSDFDGYIIPPIDLRDISMMPVLTNTMVHMGYTDDRIRKILGENFLRVWRENVAGAC